MTKENVKSLEYWIWDAACSIRGAKDARNELDIYATSIDYDPGEEASQLFFATVQNKMHWAAHGQTAAEVVQGGWMPGSKTWG
jgi:hypothetical protein